MTYLLCLISAAMIVGCGNYAAYLLVIGQFRDAAEIATWGAVWWLALGDLLE